MSLPAGPGAPPASIAPWPLTARGAPAFDRCHALVIDGNPASRSVLAAMLRDVGVGTVVQSSRAQDARRLIEYRHFHIVVCEYHFESQPMTGQDLMDDLRLAQVMPLSTVVVMISSEAAYTRVAEAAEAALDAYLIKPHTEAALRERIHQAMQRKLALRDIIDLVEAGRYDQAIAQCQARCDARTPNWLNAARIGAELCLRQGRMGPAMGLLEAILSTQALPWARLGYARTEYQAGGMQQARRTLESLLNDQPGYADAYDVMGRVLLDQGEPEAALHAMRRACGLTPGSVARLQKLGLLAFYHGEPAEAARVLQRAAALGLNSKVFDLQALVLLGTLQYDQGDHRGLGQSLRSISAARAEQPQSARLRRFEQVLGVLHQLQQRRVAEAMAGTRHAVGEAQEADFEFEAACNLLSMLARLLSRELWPEAVDEWVGALADRFTVSRTTCELMCRACSAVPALVALIQARYAAVCEQAERAVEHTVSGHPRTAVLELLAGAERSFNAKLIDLALHTLARHRHTISQADELEQRARALDRRYRSYGTQVQLRGRPAPGAACGLAA